MKRSNQCDWRGMACEPGEGCKLQKGHTGPHKYSGVYVGEPPAEEVIEMALCEVPHTYLRAGQLYRFIVVPGCKECESQNDPYA